MIRDVKDLTSFKWATVRGTDPLSIQLDGDPAPLALIPDSLVDPMWLSVGDRVRVELSLRKVVIHGKSNGAKEPPEPPEPELPAPFRTSGEFGSVYPIGTPASTWGSVIATSESPLLALETPAWVKVEYGAILSASTGYVRIGLAVTGTVTYGPGEDGQGSAGTTGGLTPFHLSPNQSWTQGQATYLLPAGNYRFVLQSMRSSSSSTCTCNYPMIQITPLRWA